jgi:dTDP-4-dehydrorhamnose 3,5-epimerase
MTGTTPNLYAEEPVEVQKVGIAGVRIYGRTIIKDRRGKVMHGLRENEWVCIETGNGRLGEAYFSVVNPKVVKAWHLHHEMTLRYVCVFGRVMVGLCDQRKASPTRGAIAKVYLEGGGADYKILVVPPGVWNGFRSVFDGIAIVANFADMPHQPSGELERMPPGLCPWPFDWGEYEYGG